LTLDRYLAALAELGLQPGASIEEVRKAWKAVFRTVHPDLYPNDPEKLERAKAINNARDELEAMSKAGLLVRFAKLADYDRRTGSTEGTKSTRSFLLDIFVIVAPAGFGKTYSWARAQRPRGGGGLIIGRGHTAHVILASPTVDLIDQTLAMLVANGVSYATALHSRNTTKGVHRAVAAYHDKISADADAILLISHAEILHHPLPPEPEDWDLVFDEMPECISFLSIDAPFTHRHITRYLRAEEALSLGLYQLVPKDDAAMTRLIRMAGNRNPHDGALEYFKPMAAAIVSGHVLLVPKVQYDDLTADEWPEHFAGHLDILVIVPPVWFRNYRSVTMMGARAYSHFTSLVWSRLWKVNFIDDDRFKLPKKHGRTQSRLLTIHYIFEERTSRGFLAKVAQRGGTLFSAACEAVAKFYKSEDFLWSAPRPGEDKMYGVEDRFWKKRGAFRPSLRLPGKTHGLNKPEYMEVHNVALMSVVQFTPNQFTLLHTLGLTDEQINKAVSFDVAYQDMMRCSLRQDRDGMPPRIPVRDLTHAVHVTVMDRQTAEDIAREFTGCKVRPYPKALVPQPLERKNKRGPTASGSAKSSTERSRARRARMALFRQERDDRKNEAA
jgi:hypothetical protein